MNFYYCYDGAGFEVARFESLLGDPITLENLEEVLIYASHDLNLGHCHSFQFYLSTGQIMFNSEVKQAA